MQSLAPTLINQKWLLCSLFSFSSFIFLSLYLNPSQNPPTNLPSLQNLNPSSNLSPLPSLNLNTSISINLSPNPLPITDLNHNMPPSPLPSLELPSSSVLRKKEFPSQEINPTHDEENLSVELKEEKCDFYDGKWVYDPKNYPLYNGKQCPFLSEQVTCQKNGRPDSFYENWKWEARGCEIARFNATNMLGKLRGKRVVIIGDSLNRNQWESLVCLLYSSIHPSRAVVKTRSSHIFRAKDYDCSVEFYWSPFLVRLDEMTNGSKIIRLEKLSESARKWQGADVMIFNMGYWWTHHGRKKPWNYFEYKGKLLDMRVYTAFKIAMTTWARWIDRTVDPNKTRVFFRSISPVHKKMNLQWCFNQIQPIANQTYIQWFPRQMISIVEKTIQDMKTPVTYLNITKLSQYRQDAHTSIYTMRKWKLLTKEQRNDPDEYADCDHWCLPGVPDTWNVLLYTYIM